MRTHNGPGAAAPRGALTSARGRSGPVGRTAPEAAPDLTPAGPARRPELKFRGPMPDPTLSPLPPLRPAHPVDPAALLREVPETPRWSPVAVAAPLFVAVWACFAAMAATVEGPAGAEIAALGHLVSTGVGVMAVVLVTLSVVHTQISGLWPRPAVLAVVGAGAAQGALAWSLGSGPADLWSIAAWLLALIGVAVPLAWVGGRFQYGVRRQRVEQHASLAASRVEKARHQAQVTVQSVQRHDVRSMLFVIDGATQMLSRPDTSAEQRGAFADMLTEGVGRLGALMDVRAEEIQPFALDGAARAVVHAERRAGRSVTAKLPEGLSAVGRAADVAAVLRTLAAVAGRHGAEAVALRGDVEAGAAVVLIEPSDAEALPLLMGNWEQIRADSFKASRNDDEDLIDLYVAARLLAEQGADLWSTAGRARFAVRLPVAGDIGSEEEA